MTSSLQNAVNRIDIYLSKHALPRRVAIVLVAPLVWAGLCVRYMWTNAKSVAETIQYLW
jgi:hypothetical protein